VESDLVLTGPGAQHAWRLRLEVAMGSWWCDGRRALVAASQWRMGMGVGDSNPGGNWAGYGPER
jgi:hypothetical protein